MAATTTDEPHYIVQYLNLLGSRAVRFGTDYVPSGPVRKRGLIKKNLEHIVSEAAEPSELKAETSSSTNAITLKVKSLKGGHSYTLTNVDPSMMTVLKLKETVAIQSKIAVPAQRLLLKGKALADAKLLAEYEGIIDGATINLVEKTPGAAVSPPPSESGSDAILKTTEFWSSLRMFLGQHFQKAEDADGVLGRFLGAYRDLVGELSVADVAAFRGSK